MRQVMCVDTNHVAPHFKGRKWLPCAEPEMLAMLLSTSIMRNKEKAEKDPTWLQVIPYVVFRSNGQLFSYDRNGDERRLHGCRSIGVGGHIEELNYWKELSREVQEEVGLEMPVDRYDMLGFIYDPSTPVGAVHLGVAYQVSTPKALIEPGPELYDPQWIPISELDVSGYETWSHIVFTNAIQ